MEISNNYIDACLECVITCESCSTDCVANGTKECILFCRDCADLCALCACFEIRGSQFSASLYALCAEICRACAAECVKHAMHNASCKACLEACEKCATICEELVAA